MPIDQDLDIHPDDHELDDHDRGLEHDLATLAARSTGRVRAGIESLTSRKVDRRRALTMLGGGAAAAVLLAACKIPTSGGGYAATPEETAGPYPGDGTNGPNALATSGIVRSNIRSSFGGMTGTASGIPLTIKLAITDVSDGNVFKQGAAVYLWHCDQAGRYSLYSPGVTDQNYLRGVQVVPKTGIVTFKSIFPACYSGRWPHIHFEVYRDLAKATSGANKIATSQMAMPQDVCNAVYATSGYSQSVNNLAQTSLATDMVFADGSSHQLATVTGNVNDGLVASLTAAVA
jgi:protocatechuate 3,4-dioxygenase beta subunit